MHRLKRAARKVAFPSRKTKGRLGRFCRRKDASVAPVNERTPRYEEIHKELNKDEIHYGTGKSQAGKSKYTLIITPAYGTVRRRVINEIHNELKINTNLWRPPG